MYEEITRLFDIPRYQLGKYPKADAFASKINGEWVPVSIQETLDKAYLVSHALCKSGIKKGDKVAIISTNNRPEWVMVDIGVLQTGAVDVPVYPTIGAEEYKYIFNHAEVKLCFVSDKDLYDKVAAIRDEVPTLQEIYTFDLVSGARHWSEFLETGRDGKDADVDAVMAGIDRHDLATIIYTSGTTGVPKGVMLSHWNIASNAINCVERLPVDAQGKALSFLPLCHVYERMLIYLYMLTGVSVYFAESMETIGDNLREVKPDVFTAVPRLLEKVYDKIVAKGAELNGIKKALFFWALSLGERYMPYGQNGAWYEFQLGIARRIIFSKWQAALGGNVKAVASGSAALQPRLARVFNAAGVPVMEGYGLTETSPVISVNCMDMGGFRIGTIGKPIRDAQVKIAEDGEILTKGPNLMLGYYKDPDRTAEVMDAEGWFHTGDIGEIDKDGFLKITDRKKEIFKTSGGKYVAPQPMENSFKQSKFIEQIMVVGDGKKHPAALIVPAFEFLKEWAARKGIPYINPDKAIEDQKVIARIQQEVDEMNKPYGKWEQIKKFELLSQPFAIETGELTPTLKLKRKVILEKYKHLIDRIYEDSHA
jgi:long-chain acyl-CoA synthetase